MGSCSCTEEKDKIFHIDDLKGIDKYYPLMSKRKAEIFKWLMSSDGPWDTPSSFDKYRTEFVSTAKNGPVQVTNADEMYLRVQQHRTMNKFSSTNFRWNSLLVVDSDHKDVKLSPMISQERMSEMSSDLTSNDNIR
ncbi:unnamed protein product [Didymodactylos carnosus]|uniref:Uncharacterized protein n=1 Tax=Didymodactylos carnosus TaxID=1234261 RepID=A0A814T398_9BILA|nr:unnamed protein product [Didymodactylos carnosus]CAF1307984.1 unnamed protein product [Didymodactylos carnosus]CAF3919504.1 unnamed protein product [Didymodactylos carnosus]CAF4115226.1 unnamed protein product [Didymodactylos carnosus]